MKSKSSDFNNARGFSLFIIFIALIEILFAVFYISPLHRFFLVKSYIVDDAQIQWVENAAFEYGIISIIIAVLLFIFGYLLFSNKIRIRSGLLINLLTIIISVIVFASSIEMLTTVMLPRGKNIFRYNHTLTYELNPGVQGKYQGVWYQINDQGFIGNNITPDKTDDEIRHLFIGNSITFGYAVNYNRSFVSLVENNVGCRIPEQQYRAVNLAVSGYNLDNYLYRMNEFPDYEFDRIFVGFCFNDLIASMDYKPDLNVGFFREDVSIWENPLKILIRLYLYKSNAVFFTSKFIGQIQLKIFASKDRLVRRKYSKMMTDIYLGVESEVMKNAWDETISKMDKIYEYSQKRKIPLTLLIFPESVMHIEGADSSITNYPAAPLVTWADQMEIDHLDYIKIYRQYADSTHIAPETLNFDGVHPTPEGHELIARSIENYLFEKEIINSQSNN